MDMSESIYFPRDELSDLPIDITNNPIMDILSCSVSLSRKKTLICTRNGFCLINNGNNTFKRYEGHDRPFIRDSDNGVAIGSIVEERTEVALIPQKNTKNYKKTCVYIYDYKLKDILYENDFFLPIRQITLTDQSIILSNNKRIIVYNYESDDINECKDQAYYLGMYKDACAGKTTLHNIRYIEMNCEEKFCNNSIFAAEEEEEEGNGGNIVDFSDLAEKGTGLVQSYRGDLEYCKCGSYQITQEKPYKILYTKVYEINKSKRISLYLYDWAIDKSYIIQSFPDQNPFCFAISPDGKFIAYSENQAKTVKILSLTKSGTYCTLWVSRSLKIPLCNGFMMIKGQLWYSIVRSDGNSAGNMHLFKVEEKKEGEYIESQYKRGFNLYEKTLKEYNIKSKEIADFYVEKDAVYCLSVCGIVHSMIDFKRTGNHPKKTVQNFSKWVEQSQQV